MLFKAWNDTKLVGKEATNGPVVKRALCRSVLKCVHKSGVPENEMDDNHEAKWAIDFTLECLRNSRGPTREPTAKRMCLLLLNHEKVREVGEEQLQIQLMSILVLLRI